ILLVTSELPTPPELVDLYVAVGDRQGSRTAFELAVEARRAGLQAQLELAGRSLKGQLRHADRIGARYVAIVCENGSARLKNMESGDEHDALIADVIPEILREGREL
ncbi:MAG: His/Gly/Thr/Pro-type tRNA ligase C-terminal domain-containing protein, partial [Solirubrobacteraceae bacterium]